MKKNDKNYKSDVATKNTPSNETNAGNGIGASVEALLTDEPSTGAFEEEPKTEKPTAEQAIAQGEAVSIVPAVKPILSLDERLQAIQHLHRLNTQRENLLSRMYELEAFEIELIDEADELESNHFAGCRLIIQDGRGKQFVTSHANLVKMTAEFIRKACEEKKAELEAKLVFPN